MNTARMAHQQLPLFAPWLHTYALPMYAVLAVVVALIWGLRLWLRDAEDHAAGTLNRARRILRTCSASGRRTPALSTGSSPAAASGSRSTRGLLH